MLRSCVMIIYRSARQNQAHSTQHDPYCSCPQIQQPILLLSPRLFELSSQRCIMKWNTWTKIWNKGEKRADFYIIHLKTFPKTQREQSARMPHSKSTSENAYRIGGHNKDRYLFFLGLCLRLWVQHFSSSSLCFQCSMSVACHECRTDNSSVTSSQIQTCPDINTHIRGKTRFLCIGNYIFS